MTGTGRRHGGTCWECPPKLIRDEEGGGLPLGFQDELGLSGAGSPFLP